MKTSLVTPNTAGNRIDGEHHVGRFDDDQHHEQRRREELAVLAGEEMRADVLRREAHEAPKQEEHRVLLRVGFLLAAAHQAHGGEDQKRPEDVHDEVEVREQRGADGDEEAAGDQRADDSPEQDAVLQVRGHGEVRKRHQEHEQVVDGQRLLDQPRLEELQRAIGAAVKVDAQVEEQRHADPDRRPDRGLARADDVRLAVKHAEIQREHHEHDGAEHHPRHRFPRDHRGLTSRR
jgi:hypothetical protein